MKKPAKMSNKERMEWKGLQGAIDSLTERKVALDSKLSRGEGGYTELEAMTAELAAVEVELEEQEMRWLELAEAFPEETGQ